MTQIKSSKSTLMVFYVFLSLSRCVQTAPTTFSPLSTTFTLNNTEVTSIGESGKIRIASIHFDDNSHRRTTTSSDITKIPTTASPTTTRHIETEEKKSIEKKYIDKTKETIDDGKDGSIHVTKTFPLLSDKLMKHSRKQNLRKSKDKIPKGSLKFQERNNMKNVMTTTATVIPMATVPRTFPSKSDTTLRVSEGDFTTATPTPSLYLHKLITFDETTTISAQLSESTENLSKSQNTGSKNETVSETVSTEKFQYSENDEGKQFSTTISNGMNIYEDDSIIKTSFSTPEVSSTSPTATETVVQHDTKTVDDTSDYSVVKTTTATTTPEYNEMIKVEEHKNVEMKSYIISKKILEDDIKTTAITTTTSGTINDMTVDDNTNSDSILPSSTSTTAFPFSKDSKDSVVNTTSLHHVTENYKSNNEKIINSYDVEKIDLKSKKRNNRHDGVDDNIDVGGRIGVNEKNENADIEKTIFGSIKKKVSGIVMGHDGVKVTKKKQLMEKSFKDDETMIKTHLTKNREEEKRLSGVDDENNKENGNKRNERIENGNRNIDTVITDMSSNIQYHDDKKTKFVSKYDGPHLGPLIMQEKTIADYEKIDNNVMSDIKHEKNIIMDAVNSPNNDSASDKFNEENIPPNFDVLDIETNAKKIFENEKLKFTNRSSFADGENIKQSFEVTIPQIPTHPSLVDSVITTQQNFNTNSKDFVVTTISGGDPVTLMSNDNDSTAGRTDATEPEVVTERSLVPASFTNVNKHVELLEVEIIPEDVTTLASSTSEVILTIHHPSFESISMRGMSYVTSRNKDHIASLVSDGHKNDNVHSLKSFSIQKPHSEIKYSLSSSDNQKHISIDNNENSEVTTTSHDTESVADIAATEIPKVKHTRKETPPELPSIEIQINVSEHDGMDLSKMLEFSFRENMKKVSLENEDMQTKLLFQPSSIVRQEIGLQKGSNSESITLKPSKIGSSEKEFLNESDILVVEITDNGNGTDDNSKENGKIIDDNPKFTIHNDGASDYDVIGDSRISQDYGNVKNKPSSRESISDEDDLFVPDLKLEPIEDFNPGSSKSFSQESSSVDRDSDTIFYISNTEVKVVESIPTPNPVSNTQTNLTGSSSKSHHRSSSNVESQFFPSIYEEDVIIDFPNKNSSSSGEKGTTLDNNSMEQYKEDIILSPLKNNFDPLKMIRNRGKSGTSSNYGLTSSENSKTSSRHDEMQKTLPQHVESRNNINVRYIGGPFNEQPNTLQPSPSNTENRNKENTHGIASFTPSNRKEHDIHKTKTLLTSTTSTTDASENAAVISNVIIQPAVIPEEISIGVPVIAELPPQIQLKDFDYMLRNNRDSNPANDDGIQYGGDVISNVGGGSVSGVGYDIDSAYGLGGGGSSGIHDTNSHRAGGVDAGNEIDYKDKDLAVTSHIIIHAVNNLQKDQLVAEVPSSEGNTSEIRDSQIKRGSTNVNATMPEKLSNATAYSVLDDNDGEFNFTDLQTLILACFTTLVPLVLLAVMGYVARFLWIKYARRDSQGSLVGDNSTDLLAAKSMDLSQNELKSTESGITINRSNHTLESSTEIVSKYDGIGGSGGGGRGCGLTQSGSECANGCALIGNSGGDGNCNSKLNDITTTNKINHSGANGSVTTMTLKNNHLIVETEERNDISRDARETKMHYTPSEKDGVFVVEVSRGADSKGMPLSPLNHEEQKPKTCTIDIEKTSSSNTDNMVQANEFKSSTHEEVQIHQPPSADDDGMLADKNERNLSSKLENGIIVNGNLGNSNTGLSQSDLSTSSGDSNKGYTYGNQQLYEINGDGYNDGPNLAPAVLSSPSNPDSISNGQLENENSNSNSNEDDTNSNHNNNNNSNYKTNTGNYDNIETKPIIKAALLKQDTVMEITNCVAKSPKMQSNNKENVENGAYETQPKPTNGRISPSLSSSQNNNELNDEIETNGFDSIVSLPAPPSTEEIKQMNDVILSETTQLDSLPPPPPPTDLQETVNDTATSNNGDGNQNQSENVTNVTIKASTTAAMHEGQNGVAVLAVGGSS